MSHSDEHQVEEMVKARATAIANQVVGRLFFALLMGAFAAVLTVVSGVWWLSAKFSSYEATITALQDQVKKGYTEQAYDLSALEQ